MSLLHRQCSCVVTAVDPLRVVAAQVKQTNFANLSLQAFFFLILNLILTFNQIGFQISLLYRVYQLFKMTLLVCTICTEDFQHFLCNTFCKGLLT